jgi:hypothetical protein
MLKAIDMKNTKNAENPFISSLQIPSIEIFPQKGTRLWAFFLIVFKKLLCSKGARIHTTVSIGW